MTAGVRLFRGFLGIGQVVKSDAEFHVPYLKRAEDAIRRQDWVGAEDMLKALLEHLPLPADERYKVRERLQLLYERAPQSSPVSRHRNR